MIPRRWPFGKHKGEDICDLPTDYIEWALGNMDLDLALTRELENQLKMRSGEGVDRPRGGSPVSIKPSEGE